MLSISHKTNRQRHMSRERMFKNYLTTQTYHFPKELHDIYQKVPSKAGSDEVKEVRRIRR